jgi:hypothetical protein
MHVKLAFAIANWCIVMVNIWFAMAKFLSVANWYLLWQSGEKN